jgi:hypothetical protein
LHAKNKTQNATCHLSRSAIFNAFFLKKLLRAPGTPVVGHQPFVPQSLHTFNQDDADSYSDAEHPIGLTGSKSKLVLPQLPSPKALKTNAMLAKPTHASKKLKKRMSKAMAGDDGALAATTTPLDEADTKRLAKSEHAQVFDVGDSIYAVPDFEQASVCVFLHFIFIYFYFFAIWLFR